MKDVSTTANEAIFHLQLNSRDAVRYVMRQTGCDSKIAEAAVASVMTSYK